MQRLAEELGVRERDDSFCCQVGFGLGVGLVEGLLSLRMEWDVLLLVLHPPAFCFGWGQRGELARSPAMAPLCIFLISF